MPETPVARRTVLRGLAAATALSYSKIYGANERVQLGLIGSGERGRGDMGNFIRTNVVDVTAVCDVYASQIDAAKKVAPNAQSFSDHRKLLETKEIDAVLSDGRNVFQGREGDIIEGRYRILRIGVESLEMAYLDGRGRLTIRLTGS